MRRFSALESRPDALVKPRAQYEFFSQSLGRPTDRPTDSTGTRGRSAQRLVVGEELFRSISCLLGRLASLLGPAPSQPDREFSRAPFWEVRSVGQLVDLHGELMITLDDDCTYLVQQHHLSFGELASWRVCELARCRASAACSLRLQSHRRRPDKRRRRYDIIVCYYCCSFVIVSRRQYLSPISSHILKHRLRLEVDLISRLMSRSELAKLISAELATSANRRARLIALRNVYFCSSLDASVGWLFRLDNRRD